MNSKIKCLQRFDLVHLKNTFKQKLENSFKHPECYKN